MNKDHIEGTAEEAKGKTKEFAGKATGDKKLESEGKVDQLVGKAQQAWGNAKDAAKEAFKGS